MGRREIDRLNQEARQKHAELNKRQAALCEAKEALQRLEYEYSESERLSMEIADLRTENQGIAKQIDIVASRTSQVDFKMQQQQQVCLL